MLIEFEIVEIDQPINNFLDYQPTDCLIGVD